MKLKVHKRLHSAGGEMDLSINFNIREGQFITLFGESGAGKTSVLRMIAGLMQPDEGLINVHDQIWYDSEKKINLSPQKRNIGVVFQDYALFPNMTVRENLQFALQKGQNHKVINELIEIVELGSLESRSPLTLSGGQKQRVAIARAIVQRPKILLLDEPLSALDAKIRIKLQDYLLDLHRSFGLTTILISHDVSEIFKLSDDVIKMKQGSIIKQGSPTDVFINQEISGKFKFAGEVLHIEKQEVIYVITVMIQSTIVKVVAQESEVTDLHIGDRVMVASKAFNPIIYRIDA